MARTASQARRIRDLVGIGQVWQHDDPEYRIVIKQIHRADRLVEAWFDGPQGRTSRAVPFSSLHREYDLIG